MTPPRFVIRKFIKPQYAIGLVLIILSIRMIAFTQQFAINMMFWDQWDFYNPLFAEQGPIAAFRYQHGVHRQGVGGILIYITAHLSGWQGEWDSYLVAASFIIAAILAVILKLRFVGYLNWFDLIIPYLFLSLNQYETLVIVPNLAPSALPLLFIILYGIILTFEKPVTQAVSLLFVNFCLLYTGYSFFLAFITPILFLYRTLTPEFAGFHKTTRPIWLSSFVLSVLSLGSFFVGWVYSPAIDCAALSHPNPFDYLLFVGLQVMQGFAIVPMAPTLGIANGLAALIGLVMVFVAIAVAARAWLTTHGVIISSFIGFSLLYVILTAVGRICLSVTVQPLSSRYSTLILPLILGLYMWAAKRNARSHMVVGIVFCSLILLSNTPPFYRDPAMDSTTFHTRRASWKSCYLDSLDPYSCDLVAGYSMYGSTPHIEQRLRYLEKNKLNLFQDMNNDIIITSPTDESAIMGNEVLLAGILDPEDFDSYHVQWGEGDFPEKWHWLSGPHLSSVRNEVITTWDTSELPAGFYTVRVTVFLGNGDQKVAKVRLIR